MPVISNVWGFVTQAANAVGSYAWDIIKAVTLLK